MFKMIKEAIGRSLVFLNLNYYKDVHIFSFVYKDTIAGVLLQKNDEDKAQPIAFMIKALQNSELKYEIMGK